MPGLSLGAEEHLPPPPHVFPIRTFPARGLEELRLAVLRVYGLSGVPVSRQQGKEARLAPSTHLGVFLSGWTPPF